MTTLDQLPERMPAGDDEARRTLRLVHEDVMSRLAAVHEGISALGAKLDECHASLLRVIAASRAETRAMFEQVVSRLDAANATRNKPRRSKKP